MWSDGNLDPAKLGLLDISVGPKLLDRALRFMAGLLDALEKEGMRVQVRDRRTRGTVVYVDGEELVIALREHLLRTPHVPTAEERAEMRRQPEVRACPHWNWIHTGKLRFTIFDEMVRGVRYRWWDGKRTRLEARVDDIVQGLRAAAEVKRTTRTDRERAAGEWHEEIERASRPHRDAEAERKRFEDLEQAAQRWQRSRLIRDFVAAVETAGTGRATGEVANWCVWARNYAASLDPITSRPYPRPSECRDSPGYPSVSSDA